MPSKLGSFIRQTRQAQNMSLRELARRVDKSPAYIVSLERSEVSPGVAEATLMAIAGHLGIDPDALLTLASKIPEELIPRTATEVALYRLIRDLPSERQDELKVQLESEAYSVTGKRSK